MAIYLTESLLEKTVYSIEDKSGLKFNTGDTVHTSKKSALEPYLKGSLYNYNIKIEGDTVIIPKRFKSKIESLKVVVYTIKAKINKTEYYTEIKGTGKVIDEESISLIKLIDDLSMKIEYNDNSKDSSDRKKYYDTCINKLNQILNKKEFKDIKSSIKIEKEDKEAFINGEINSVRIAYYDLHKFYPNARQAMQDDGAKDFWNLMDKIKSELKSDGFNISTDGDWDDGFIELYQSSIKESFLNQFLDAVILR